MKINFSSADKTKIASSVIVVFSGIAFYLLLQNFSQVKEGIGFVLDIFQPFIYGFVIAFLLNGLVKFCQEKLLKKAKLKPKAKRGLSILITYIVVFSVIILLLCFIIPQLVDSIADLVKAMPDYIKSFNRFLQERYGNFLQSDIFTKVMQLGESFLLSLTDYIKISAGKIVATTTDVILAIINIFVGIFVSVYLLADKERFLKIVKKICFAFAPKKAYLFIKEIANITCNTFSRYITGQIIDSFLIGLITLIFMTVTRMPYGLLIATIITITNLIPIFGPIIGCIPSALILLVVSPWKAVIFVIYIIILQQIDGNFLCPKIVGNSTGLAAFWVMFSIFVGGDLFGIAGMVVAVPAFSVIYYIMSKIVNKKIKEKADAGDSFDLQ